MERSACAVQVRFLLTWNQVSQRGREAKGWPGRKPRASAQNANAARSNRGRWGQRVLLANATKREAGSGRT